MNAIELISNPAVSMGIAAIAGFFMKAKALDAARLQEERLYNIEAYKVGMSRSNSSANAASERDGATGKATRRLVALILIGAVVALVFLPGLLDKPSVIETVKTSGGWLFGLFPDRTKTEFISVQGFVHMPALLVGFGHVIAFYFGQGAAKP